MYWSWKTDKLAVFNYFVVFSFCFMCLVNFSVAKLFFKNLLKLFFNFKKKNFFFRHKWISSYTYSLTPWWWQVLTLFPSSQGLKVTWSSVVKIGQSLYREGPGKDPFRPNQKTPVKNFFLAGSYTKQVKWPCLC